MAAAVGCEPCVGVFCMSPLHTAAVMSASLLYFFVPPFPSLPSPSSTRLNASIIETTYSWMILNFFFFFQTTRWRVELYSYLMNEKQPFHLPHTSEVQHQPSLGVDSPSHGCPMLLRGWSIRCGGFTQCCLTASWNIMTSIGSVPK